jgi:flagellum-specific peptidoglycan hydrolase FlgJ
MKKLLLFFILIFLSSCSSFRPLSESNLSVDDQINLYIKKYAPAATKNMRFYKIPASITLAQGILESGHGQSTLAKKANNHFGIKCHKGWKGKSISHDDDAKDECFRSYKNPLRSYKDHSLFLVERDRYSSLFKLNRKDYKSWAIGLKAAGYATDPKYADKLISLIERFRLNRFDE